MDMGETSLPAAARGKRRAPIDWGPVERDVLRSPLTLAELARRFDIPKGTLTKQVWRKKWVRLGFHGFDPDDPKNAVVSILVDLNEALRHAIANSMTASAELIDEVSGADAKMKANERALAALALVMKISAQYAVMFERYGAQAKAREAAEGSDDKAGRIDAIHRRILAGIPDEKWPGGFPRPAEDVSGGVPGLANREDGSEPPQGADAA